MPSPLSAELVELRSQVACILQRRSDTLATDRIQELILRGLAGLPSYSAHADGVRPWFFGIALNLRRETARRTRRERNHFCPDLGDAERTATPDASPEEGAARSEARCALLAALKTLPAEQCVVLVLVDLLECSCSEAAEQLGIPLGTVKSRLLAARTHMLRVLGPKEQYLGSAIPPVMFGRRALARRLFDYVYPLGHLLLALLFFAVPRTAPPEPHAVMTGAARVLGASAADVAKAAQTAASPAPAEPPVAPPARTPAPRHATVPEPFNLKPPQRPRSPVGGKGWSW